jgi:hypothetical protein
VPILARWHAIAQVQHDGESCLERHTRPVGDRLYDPASLPLRLDPPYPLGLVVFYGRSQGTYRGRVHFLQANRRVAKLLGPRELLRPRLVS